ncbi:hypothetical protein [Kingella oralis]
MSKRNKYRRSSGCHPSRYSGSLKTSLTPPQPDFRLPQPPAEHVKQTQTHLTTPPKSSLIAPSRGNRHPNETETT